MAIKVGGTEVVSDARALSNITSIDATTAAAIGAGGVGGGGEVDFTASGSLTNGDLVKLNLDGTVSVIEGGGAGTPAVFESAAVNTTSSTFDSNSNKVVIAYRDQGNSYYGTAVVGTVSGDSISFGTPVVFRSGNTGTLSTTFDSNSNKVVIAFSQWDLSNYGAAIVGTVSGTSISFGSETVFESATTSYISATFDSNSNKVVIAYRDAGNSSYGTAVVGTVSGTSISFGSAVTFQTASVSATSAICFDSTNNKVVICYRNSGSSHYGTAKVGTVSGTSISFGTDVFFNSANTRKIKNVFDAASGKVVTVFRDYGDSSKGKAVVGTVSGTGISFGSEVELGAQGAGIGGLAYDSNTEKTVVSFYDEDDSSKGKSRVGTVSGTSISFGTVATFDSGTNTLVDSTFDPTTNKVIIIFKDGSDNKGNFITGTVSGTDISFDSKVEFSSSDANPFDVTYDTNAKKAIVVFDNPTGSNSGDATVITPSGNYPNLTSENFIGFSDGAFATTQSAAINTTNTIDRNQSGLTAGQTYFVQNNGTIGLTAASPSVTAGTAISATELIVKG